MTQELERQIQQRTKFQFTDPLGKGRIRNLMWEYDCLRRRKNDEIEGLKDIAVRQAEAVTSMVIRANKLEKENEMLREAIRKSDEVRKNLAKKLSIVESEKVSLEMDYLNLKNKYELEDAS